MASRHRSAQEWKHLIVQFESSELTQEAFAHRHRVGLSAFRGWLYRLRKTMSGGDGRFLDVQPMGTLPASDGGRCCIVVELPSGIRVVFDDKPSSDYLADFLGRLRGDR